MSIRLGSSLVDYSIIETILEYNTISEDVTEEEKFPQWIEEVQRMLDEDVNL